MIKKLIAVFGLLLVGTGNVFAQAQANIQINPGAPNILQLLAGASGTSLGSFPTGGLFTPYSNQLTKSLTTSYTFLAADRGYLVSFNSGSAISGTLQNANYAAGYVVDLVNIGAGNLVVTPASGTINGVASLTLLQGNGAHIVFDGTNYEANLGTTTGSGSGTVTSVATDSCLTGGPINTSGTLSGNQTVNAQTSTSYTVAAGDKCKLVNFSNTAATAVTLPQATGSFGAGWYVDVQNINSGLVTFTPTTSNIDGLGTFILPQGYGVRFISDGTNYHVHGFNPLQGRVLIASTTASSSATIIFTGLFTTTFRDYEIEIQNLLPSATATCGLRLTSGGTPLTTGYLTTSLIANSASSISNPTTQFNCTSTNGILSTGEGLNSPVPIVVQNPGVSGIHSVQGLLNYTISGPATEINSLGGYYTSAVVIDGFVITPSTGTWASGKVFVYGRN